MLIFAAALAVAAPELTLERIYSEPPLEGRAPREVQFSPTSAWVSFLRPSDANRDVLELWGAHLPDGKQQLLVASADVLGGAAQKLSEKEKMALERKRISEGGITEYRWCGDDGRTLLFPLSGDLYVAHLPDAANTSVRTQRLTHDEEPELSPQCSTHGRYVSFTKRGDVYVVGADGRGMKKLTRGGSDTRSFGLAEFIAQEEMDRQDGLWWSPDEKQVLLFEVDESVVGVKTRAQIHADHTDMVTQRYPAAGEKNAVVTPHLFDVATARERKIDHIASDGYWPRAGFFKDGTAWLQWQSRDQKTLSLFEVSARGALRMIADEHDDVWVELHDDLHGLPGRDFLWSSEKSGRRQLERRSRDDATVVAITAQPEAVDAVLAVAGNDVFFSGRTSRGRELHVFRVPTAGGAPTQLTRESGMHRATFADDGNYWLDRHSRFGVPTRTVVRDADGNEVVVLDDNPAQELRTYPRTKPQWLDVTADDGTILNALALPPTSVTPGQRYPVITYVYGGPYGQTVMDGWDKNFPLFLRWTERGYGVFLIDNRGMAGRDRAFSRAIAGRFGDVEVKDLFAGVGALKKLPWVDGARVGIWGWSYGGYLAARAVLDEKTPFAAAVAVAPVTDWSLYDTHYTEQFLGMPKNADGTTSASYASANLVARAKLLQKPLLLMHGTADDNVLFEHTLRLTEALQRENKSFQLMIYPGKAHGISGKVARLHVFSTVEAFFAGSLERP